MKNYLRYLAPVLLMIVAVVFGGGKILAADVTTTQTTFTAISADNIGGDKNVSYSTAKGGASTAPGIYSNEIRLYQGTSSKNGGTITINAKDGITIKSVVIGSSQTTSIAYSVDGSTTQSDKSSLAQDAKYTVNNITASSVTFYCWGTTNKQRLNVNYLSVTYSESSGKTSTSISFPTISYEFTVGEDVDVFTNAAVLTPAEAGSVTYKSDNEHIAVVDENSGEVTVATDAVGKATITASFAETDNYKASEASYTINVVKPKLIATSISFEKDAYTFGLNSGEQTFTNVATLSPADAGSVTYKSDNDDIALVDESNGYVVAYTNKAGVATITATFAGNDKYEASTASYTITIPKTQTSLSFGEAYDGKTIDAELGEEFTAPTAILAPVVEGAAIKYASSNTKVATVDETTGAVTLVAKGTAKITASYEGNDDYAASEISYTLNVTKTVVIEDGVFDFNGGVDYGSGLTPSKNSTNITATTKFVAGNVTLTTNKADGTGFRWWIANDGNELRFYGKNNKFSTFTLSVPEGYVITNIVFTGDAYQVDGVTLTSKKWSGASENVTFTPTKTGNAIKTITVKYVKTETLTTSAKGYATYAADYAVNYSELGLTAYTLTVNDAQTEVAASEFTGVVPAGKAVLVKGEGSKEYTLTPATADADDTFATSLQTGAVTADGTQYGFTSAGETPAFKKVAVGQSIADKKGYLVLTNTSAGANLNISFGGEATGINAVEAAAADNAAVYNLAGQRVDKAYKGIVIVNGKKYLNK